MIRNLVDDGVTVLLTTQYLEEADALADNISVFHHGHVIAHGTSAELKQRVGGQTLEVRPVDPARAPDVAQLIEHVVGVRPESPQRGVLSVAVAGDQVLPPVVSALADRGIAVTELSLRLPSLDEVFFALTGQTTADDTEEGAA